jgi:hypothetical protein
MEDEAMSVWLAVLLSLTNDGAPVMAFPSRDKCEVYLSAAKAGKVTHFNDIYDGACVEFQIKPMDCFSGDEPLRRVPCSQLPKERK